ncbi:hypothetical protein D910_00932, partial [Dendroctonus ponderosae]
YLHKKYRTSKSVQTRTTAPDRLGAALVILQRIQKHIDPLLIPQQAGFRPEKSCTGQVLNLTEHIEEGFQNNKITGAEFIDLTAAYDTINHKTLLIKVYKTTKDYRLTKAVQSILQNRRFYVELQNRKSRWRTKRNGLPQGISAFHLNTHKAHNKLNVSWEGKELEYAKTPKYLGVILDRTLTYKQHCHQTRQEVVARNSLVQKLAGSKWGAKPQVLRTSAQAL